MPTKKGGASVPQSTSSLFPLPGVTHRVVQYRRSAAIFMQPNPEFNEKFLAHMLKRNIRTEEDLIDHLFNSVEKRLARTLLLLARYGTEDGAPQRIVPRLSQEDRIATLKAISTPEREAFRRVSR